MILNNMSYHEIATHLSADKQQVDKFARSIKYAKYRSKAIKLKRYPLFFKPVFFTSPQYNRWFVVPHVRNRKDLEYMPYYLGCIFKYHEKIAMYMQMNINVGNLGILDLIFTSAFFERYANRNELEKMTGEEIVFHFIQSLYHVGLQQVISQNPDKYVMFNEIGMGLGYKDVKNKKLIVFKSYVTAKNGPEELKQLHKNWKFLQSVF